MDKQLFEIEVIYFKETGKAYTTARFQREFRKIDGEGLPSPYIADVVAYLIGLRDQGGQAALPGLSGDGWSGYILPMYNGHPLRLIPPGR